MQEWTFILIYLVIQFAITIYISKSIKSEGDFFLAGRNVPTWALSFSIFATWFGAETCIGSSASVFSEGLSGSKAEPLGYTICLLLVAFFVAPKVWNEKYLTLGDFYKDKIGSSTEKLAIWILLPSSLIWSAAQIRAFGQVISLTSDVEVGTAVLIATFFVIAYTFIGGLMGDIVTDVIQGIILSLSLLGLLVLILLNFDSLDAAIAHIPKERLDIIGDEGDWLERLDTWMIPIFGSLITQELIARILAAKNKQVAVKSSLSGSVLYFIFGSIPVIIGLLMWNQNFELTDPEQFLPTVAKTYMGPFFYLIFIGALISAILSTVDSILLALSALISHNLIVPALNLRSANAKLVSARVVVVMIGIMSALIALYAESVYSMVELASSFGTTGILVVTVGAMYLKTPSTLASNLSLVVGLVLSIVFELFLPIKAAFLVNLLCVIAFYLVIHGVKSMKLKSN